MNPISDMTIGFLASSIYILGVILLIVGLLLELTAAAGVACYPVRRVLPVKSPVDLHSIGCSTMFVGFFTLLAGELLA